MERRQAYDRYETKRRLINLYSDADQWIKYNDDPDLIPFYAPLPKPPDWNLIAGFGMDPKEQTWKNLRPRMPKKLYVLAYKNKGLTIDDIWNELELNPVKWEDEIEYIKRMWYFRLNGFWFFNNGKPTYITGKHFYYMMFYPLDSGYPKYRDRDRKYWVFIDFCENHSFDFVKKDKNDWAIPEEDTEPDGTPIYLMKDLGRRVVFGDVYPKMRREGATYRAQCNNLETISKLKNVWGGIQSRTDEDARSVFQKKLVRPWKRVPFFFRPYYTGSTNPKNQLEFDIPSLRIGAGGALASTGAGLESGIDFQPGDEGAYDGWKLHFQHDDEVGKNVKNDVWKRHLVGKECLSQDFGMSIHGYTSKTSTVGEMEKGGGDKFKKMCDMSMYHQRNEIGQTPSGLFLFFMSSIDGLNCDEFGNSDLVDNERIIKAQRASLINNNDVVGWVEKVRQYPIYYRECFSSSASDLGFNLYIIEQRLQELKMNQPHCVRGDFVRENPLDRLSRVMFVEDPNNGRFVVSKQLKSGQTNRWMKNEFGHYMPLKSKYFAGSDSFRFNQTEGKRMSDGGIVVKYGRDELVDEGAQMSEMESDRYVCTYQFRPPTTDEYAEDVLMVCQYYGCQVLAEANVDVVNKKFEEWGFAGYLVYLKDNTGRFRKTPGFNTVGGKKDEIFNALRDYIQRRGNYERHPEILEDCKSIQNIDQMKNFDRLTAAGLAEIAYMECSNEYLPESHEEEEEGIEMMFQERDF